MPTSAYHVKNGQLITLQCKKCGFVMPYLKDNLKVFKPVCRACGKRRWRRLETWQQ